MFRAVVLRMQKVSDKHCRENNNNNNNNNNTHFKFNNFFLNCAVYGIMWKNTVQLQGPLMTIIIRMRLECWVT